MSIEEVQPRIYRIPSVLGRAALRAVARRRRRAAPARRLRGRRDDRRARLRRRSPSSAARRPRSPTSSSRTPTSTTTAATRSCGVSRRRRASGSSAQDRPWIESWPEISRDRYGWYRGHGLDYDEATWEWLENAAGPTRRSTAPSSDGERLDLGGIAVEVVALPGHSPGHLGVVHHESGTAIVMDAVLERGLYTTDDELISPPPYASVPAYRATIARLRELRPGAARDEPLLADRGRAGRDRVPRRERRLRRRPRRRGCAPSSAPIRSRSSTTGAPPTLRSARSSRWPSSSPGRSARTSTTRSRRGGRNAPSATAAPCGPRPECHEAAPDAYASRPSRV